MVKTQKNMGLWLISLSLIFLFNPNISAVDVLPDFIGYFILSAGISKLADLNFHFAEAQSYFNKLIKISFKCEDDFPIQNFLHCEGYSIHSIEQTEYPLFDIVITLI